MTGKGLAAGVVMGIWLAMLGVVGGRSVVAQDAGQAKYTVQVPGGLAFSEFRGYESWQVISVSHSETALAATLGNPEMIKALQSGIPGNGKLFPDGARMAKIHWNPKKHETFTTTVVPAGLHDVDFMVKDSKRFADSGDGAGPRFYTTPRPTSSRRPRQRPCHRRGTTPSVVWRAIQS